MNKKSIDKMVNEVLAMEQEEACRAGAIGYMARSLIQATMPHSRVDGHEFKRRNGSFRLTILADSEIGLPYGSIPRLLMSWVTTETVKTQQRELTLGRTLSEFMFDLDMIPSGGRWGSITRLKDQMKRLFSASISCIYDDGQNWGIRNVTPIERAELWWDPKNPHQAAVWESKLLLSDTFFREIIENPVPVDMRALKALRQSPMAIDIYCWLTYRMSYLRRITPIPWNALQVQFGANYKDVRQFKRKFLTQLKKVLFLYAGANVREESGNLVLFPGKTHVQKQFQSSNLTPSTETKKIEIVESRTDIEANSKWKKKYSEYRLESIVNIVENLPNKNERHKLLKAFENYLTRKKLDNIRLQIVKGQHTKAVKEELYNFVNSHWPHVLDCLKSYKEFCEMIAK